MESRMFDFYVPHELRNTESLVSEVLAEEDVAVHAQETDRDSIITTVVAAVLVSINFFVIAVAIAEFSRSVKALPAPQAEVQQTMGQWIAEQKLL